MTFVRIKTNSFGLVHVVRVMHKDANLSPNNQRLVSFSTKREDTYRASANGNPTSLDLLHLLIMHLFNGQLTAIVQAGKQVG